MKKESGPYIYDDHFMRYYSVSNYILLDLNIYSSKGYVMTYINRLCKPIGETKYIGKIALHNPEIKLVKYEKHLPGL